MHGERDRFVAFVFVSADLLVELDSEQHICFVAGAADTLIGKTPAQLASLPPENIISPEDRPDVRQPIRDMADGTRTEPADVRVLGPGDESAVAALLANSSAQIQEETLDDIIDRAPSRASWQERLVERPNLYHRAVKRIAQFVTASLLAILKSTTDLIPRRLSALPRPSTSGFPLQA